MDLQKGTCDGRQKGDDDVYFTIRHWPSRAFVLDCEGSQPQRKAKRAGAGQKGVDMSSESSVPDDCATIPKSRCQDEAAGTGQPTHMHGGRIMWRHTSLQPHRLAHAPTRLRLALVAGATLACTLCASLIAPAATAQPSPQTPPHEQLTIAPAEAMKLWTGDLDGMIA